MYSADILYQKGRTVKKILSIDFDFFQKVTPEIMQTCYPDGVDLSSAISTIVWSGYYANSKQKMMLDTVEILENEFYSMIDILLNQDKEIPVMIANSHLHIYDFIHSNVAETEKLYLVNADMHHDMFNQNPETDCGNWLGHISQEYDTSAVWIANPVSKAMYGITDDDIPKDSSISQLAELIPESSAVIQDKQFDMIFLCRSDNWLPPHLDNYFSEMCEVMKEHFHEIIMEQDIDKPRNYMHYAEQMKNFYMNMR